MMTNMIFEMSKQIVSTGVGTKVAVIVKDQVIAHAPEATTKVAQVAAKGVGYSAGIITGAVTSVVTDVVIETGKNVTVSTAKKVKGKVKNLKTKKDEVTE